MISFDLHSNLLGVDRAGITTLVYSQGKKYSSPHWLNNLSKVTSYELGGMAFKLLSFDSKSPLNAYCCFSLPCFCSDYLLCLKQCKRKKELYKSHVFQRKKEARNPPFLEKGKQGCCRWDPSTEWYIGLDSPKVPFKSEIQYPWKH